MSQSQKNQIRERMQEKDTEALLEIWNVGAGEDWTDEAIEVVSDLLRERLGELPPRHELDESVEDKEVGVRDTYYNAKIFSRIAFGAGILSWFFLVLGAIATVGAIFIVATDLSGMTSYQIENSIPAFANTFLGTLSGFFFFIVLRAMKEGIYILMDIEDNTRN